MEEIEPNVISVVFSVFFYSPLYPFSPPSYYYYSPHDHEVYYNKLFPRTLFPGLVTLWQFRRSWRLVLGRFYGGLLLLRWGRCRLFCLLLGWRELATRNGDNITRSLQHKQCGALPSPLLPIVTRPKSKVRCNSNIGLRESSERARPLT